MLSQPSQFWASFNTSYNSLAQSLSSPLPSSAGAEYLVVLQGQYRDLDLLLRDFELRMSAEGLLGPAERKELKEKKELLKSAKIMVENVQNKVWNAQRNALVGSEDEEEEEDQEFDDEERGKREAVRRKEMGYLGKTHQKMREAEEYAGNIGEKLFENNEKLRNALRTTSEIKGDTSLSVSLLSSLDRIQSSHRTTFYAIVLVVLVAILMFVVHKIL